MVLILLLEGQIAMSLLPDGGGNYRWSSSIAAGKTAEGA